jgi:hypothetical protein
VSLHLQIILVVWVEDLSYRKMNGPLKFNEAVFEEGTVRLSFEEVVFFHIVVSR